MSHHKVSDFSPLLLLQSVLEGIPLPALIFDAHGKICQVNWAFEKFFEVASASVSLHEHLEGLIPSDQEKLAAYCQKLEKSSSNHSFSLSLAFSLSQKTVHAKLTKLRFTEGAAEMASLFQLVYTPPRPENGLKKALPIESFYNSTPGLVILLDENAHMIGFSDYLLHSLKASRSRVQGQPLKALLTEDFPFKRLYKKLQILFRKGTLYHYPLTIKDFHGNVIEVLVNGRVEFDQGLNKNIAVLVLQDMTDLNAAQRELQLKEKAIASSNNPIILVSSQNRLTYANPAFLEVWGFSELEEVENTHFLFLFPESQHPALFQIMKNLREKGQCRGEFSIRRLKDGQGKVVDMTIAQIVQPTGEFVGYISSFFDVTEKRKSELQIRYQAALIDQVNDAIVSVDEALKVVSWNKGAERLTGIDQESVSGKSLIAFIEETAGKENFRSQLLIEGTWNGELCFITDDERTVETLVSAQKIKGLLPNEKDGFVLVFTDISSLKRQQRELNFLNEKLIKKNKSLSEFTYIVSHNLRAPIANLIGLSQLYNKNKPDDPLNGELVSQIEVSAQQLNGSVVDLNSILEVSRQQDQASELISIQEMVDQAFLPLKDNLHAHQVKLKTDFSDSAELWAIPQYFRNILQELIANSIKFRIPEVPLKIKISSKKLPYSVEIKYSDNGLGVDMARYGKKMFMLYRRFHHQIPGKGVGLYLVRTQMEAQGGEIQAESKPYKGITLLLTFPTLVK